METLKRLGCLVALVAGILPGQAETYHVSTNGVDGANDGLTWATAYRSISNAVAKAADGDTVLVSNGTYTVTATVWINKAIELKSVNGADTVAISGNNGVRCMLVSNVNAVVRGMTLTRGFLNGQGAGVWLYSGALLDSVVTNNNSGASGSSSGGGGVYLVNGTVSNCLIALNTGYYGGGVRMVGASGLLTHSRIRNNTSLANANGVYAGAGTIRNCVMDENWGTAPSAVVMLSGASLINCTVTQNIVPGSAARNVGAVNAATGSTILNTIIRDNRYYYHSPTNFGAGANPAVSYSCLEFPFAGTGNIEADPGWWKPADGNYALIAESPCIDAGSNQTWMTGATDYAGNPRLGNGQADIGALDNTPGALACAIAASQETGLAPLGVTLTGLVSGLNTNGLYYRWSYTNSAVIDEEGADKRTVAPTYSAGLHTITLVLSNAAGQTAVNDYLLKVSAPTVYVARTGINTATYPYADWTTAASNIQDAVNAAVPGAVVLLADGGYPLTAEVLLTNGVTVSSVNGPGATTVSSSTRCFYLNHPDAVVENLTLKRAGVNSLSGGCINIQFGTVRGSVITGGNLNSGGSGGGGAGAFVLFGMVSNCLIAGNYSSQGAGAGIRVTENNAFAPAVGYTSLVTHSVIRNNTNAVHASYAYGGGAALDAGIIRNCLIADNSASVGAGGVALNKSVSALENCTLSGNTSPGNNAARPGALGVVNGATVRNAIVWGNTYTVTPPTGFGSATTPDVTHCDLEFAWSGAGNISTNPGFLNPAGTNYTLSAASPCINVGVNQDWMADATDLAAEARVNGGVVDLGAYEFTLGPLVGAIMASPERGIAPLTIELSATVAGQNTNGLYFWWAFTNSAVIDAEGPDKQMVTNVYGPGLSTVYLMVSNSAGEVVQDSQILKVSAPTCYVARLGFNTSTPPYASWDTAASNIHEAVAAAVEGVVVLVTNGIYATPTTIALSEGIRVRSVNGPDGTVVSGSGARRCFSLSSVDARVEGLTIIRGHSDQGAGAFVEYGTIASCVITGCTASSGGTTAGGAAAYLIYGMASNCVLALNQAYEYGGAVRVPSHGDARVTHCAIVSNTIFGGTVNAQGGGALLEGGTLRNCLVDGNVSPHAAGGVVLGAAAVMENCTVVNNTCSGSHATHPAAVGAATGAQIVNTIVWGNTYTSATPSDFGGLSPSVSYSRLEFAWAGDGNTTADPALRNPLAGDYGLQAGSPCFNTGSNQSWMATAVDLTGKRRVVGSRVDMGAFERSAAAGTILMVR